MSKNRSSLTISLDIKTISSTEQMKSYESPLHIVSTQFSEPGITFAQKSVSGKAMKFLTYKN